MRQRLYNSLHSPESCARAYQPTSSDSPSLSPAADYQPRPADSFSLSRANAPVHDNDSHSGSAPRIQLSYVLTSAGHSLAEPVTPHTPRPQSNPASPVPPPPVTFHPLQSPTRTQTILIRIQPASPRREILSHLTKRSLRGVARAGGGESRCWCLGISHPLSQAKKKK